MAHIVIVGAGFGGVAAAYELRHEIGKEHRITLVSDRPDFQFVPSNPWIAVGRRSRDDISIDLEPYLAKQAIDFSPAGVTALRPPEKQVMLGDGSVLDYDFLVIATGPRLAFDAIPGLGPEGFTHSVCTLDHAESAYRAWQRFLENPGPIVVGAAQGASCFGPAYEFTFILDAELRKRKIRDRVPITYVTSEPYAGHMGLDGVGDSKSLMESEFRQHHIDWIANASIREVQDGTMLIDECDEEGKPKRARELPFAYSMVLPPFSGIDALRSVEAEGLVNEKGFVITDKHQRNPAFPEIYALGVCVAIAPSRPTPVPTGIPKTGYMIESMATAVTKNLAAILKGQEPTAEATWNAICLADMGDTGIAFVALPQIPPRNVTWAKKGIWVHLAKVGFEKYFLHKVKSGDISPVYENQVLSLLGIKKLKDQT